MNIRLWLFIRKIIGDILERLFATQKVVLISYFYKDRSKIFDLIGKIKKEKNALAKRNEMYQLYVLVKNVVKVKGDLAEVGVYKGTTAKVICEAKGKRMLHLFDTFEGLPKPQKIDAQFHEDQYAEELEAVQEYLKEYPNVYFYKGLFPKTGDKVKNKKFSFVHLDVDLYKSTKDALSFFYPRMSKGGIIISHDYVSPGIKKAFDEFFNDKPEPIIELPGIQCMVVKV